jgi:magnesium-protoporphyrin IX monomethyl ester (oxidative) cyclase
MVDSLKKPEFQEIRPGVKAPAKDTILTPRFYTTDFDEMATMDISSTKTNCKPFSKNFGPTITVITLCGMKSLSSPGITLMVKLVVFVEFLERSCTAEFSGFLLYKELGRRLKDKSPVLAECFNLMSRDEARHAGFLNKAMSDFNLQLTWAF